VSTTCSLAYREKKNKRPSFTLEVMSPVALSSPLQGGLWHFVGRRRELAELHECVCNAARGVPSVVSIFGPAGIGKTRLLAEFERAERLPVFWIDCRETEMEPLAAVRRLLDQLRSFSHPADHAKSPGTMGELFRCILDELRKVCAAQVCALVIEDAHWAASDVRVFVNYIIDAMNVLESKPRILMLVTFREFSVADSARAGFIETLLRRERHALQLPPLSVGEIAAMVPAYRFTERIFFELVRLSEGNPLYVQELIPVLREGRIGPLPSRIQTATRTALATLSTSARRVLYAASVIGVHFSFEDVAALCDTRNDALLDALQEASDNRFVQPGPSDSTYRFRHALIREIVYNALLPANAIRLHRRAARAIARSRGCRAHLAELAAHCERAGWRGRASILFLRSGVAAEKLHDFESAASAYLRARSNAPSHDVRLAVLAARHANCLFAIGALEEAADAFAEAAALYDRLGSVEMAAHCVDRRSLCLERVGEPQRALRELDAMLLRTKNTLPEVAARIVLSGASLSQAYRPLLAREYDKWCTRMQHVRRSQASPHRIGEMKFEAIRDVQEGRWSKGIRAFDRALELVGRLGDAEDQFGTAVLAAKYHALGGDIARSSALFRHAYVIGKSENSTWMQHLAGTRLVRLLVFSGCLGEARTLLERCVELPAYSHLMQISVATNALLLGVLQDDADLVDRFLDQHYIDMGLRYPSSAVLCDIGFSYGIALRSRNRINEARELISKVLHHVHQPWEARPFLAMTSLWGTARQAHRAQQLLTNSMHVPGAKGYVHLCLGHARQRSNDPRARHDGQCAALEFRNIGLRLFEAIAHELAQDRKRAVALYQSCGSVYDIARLTGLRSNDELFTIRQRQIVELVIRGDTNKRIAEALGIATGTVGAHLAIIYRSHGVSSRAQLVASVLAGRHPGQHGHIRPPASLSP
jgi:DNA-binding CsgD family transcriptional regulator/tetratricopeptide (TPR) repeat protein